MYPDFKELLSVLNACGVKYLIVGAYAVSVHAQPRATKDLDILVQPDAENARAVYAALVRFGAPLEGFEQRGFCRARTVLPDRPAAGRGGYSDGDSRRRVRKRVGTPRGVGSGFVRAA